VKNWHWTNEGHLVPTQAINLMVKLYDRQMWLFHLNKVPSLSAFGDLIRLNPRLLK